MASADTASPCGILLGRMQCRWRWQCGGKVCGGRDIRGASAYVLCVVAHWHTPCWFGVIADHLRPRPTKPPTQRSSVIPPGSWSAVTMLEVGVTKQSSSSSPGSKASAPCSQFWRRVVVYAPNLLGYTNNGSFRSTWSWGWFYVYYLHQPHLRCLTYPTGLQVLHPLGLTTPHYHRLYAICSHFLPPTVQLLPF